MRRLELGPRISLAQARKDLRVHVSPPTALGAPDGIFEERLESGVDVTFLYEPRTTDERIGVRRRVLVSVVRGTIEKTIIGKTVGRHDEEDPARHRRRVRAAADRRARTCWCSSARRTGAIDQTYARLAGTTLLWQREAVLVRVEGELSRARLIAIARSVALS